MNMLIFYMPFLMAADEKNNNKTRKQLKTKQNQYDNF